VYVGEHMNDELQDIPEGETVEVLPGVLGGVETHMAYHDGTVFVPLLNRSTTYSPTEQVESEPFDEANGELIALDAETGDMVWSAEQPAVNFGAATVVNDLVFTADFNGMVYAYDIETGDEVWTMQLPAGINGWPAVVGDTIYWPAGVGQNPLMVALRLGSDEPFPTPEPTATATPEGNGATAITVTAEDIAFSTNTIEASAGDEVSVTLVNNDNIPHNIAFYQTDAAEEEIAVGELITGPDATTTLTFTAPSEPGEYFFRCETHPNQMTGTFVVN
jgi:plastocyanin